MPNRSQKKRFLRDARLKKIKNLLDEIDTGIIKTTINDMEKGLIKTTINHLENIPNEFTPLWWTKAKGKKRKGQDILRVCTRKGWICFSPAENIKGKRNRMHESRGCLRSLIWFIKHVCYLFWNHIYYEYSKQHFPNCFTSTNYVHVSLLIELYLIAVGILCLMLNSVTFQCINIVWHEYSV